MTQCSLQSHYACGRKGGQTSVRALQFGLHRHDCINASSTFTDAWLELKHVLCVGKVDH